MELLTLENVVLVPHLGSATRETRTAMADLAVSNVLAVLAGRPPLTPGMTPGRAVQPAVPKRPDRRTVMRRLARAIEGLDEPAVEKIADEQADDPFQVLIATMLSAQTRDAVTHAASTRLFKRGAHAEVDGTLTTAADPAADLSGQLLSPQGRAREASLRADARRGSAAVCPRPWRSC